MEFQEEKSAYYTMVRTTKENATECVTEKESGV
jgi:hypothetical protein